MSQPASSASLIVAIAAGSAIGGVARYLLTFVLDSRSGTAFPLGTLAVNLLGCLALGFIGHLVLETGGVSPTTRALLTTGFCGGFTTFSTFAMDTVRAAEEGAFRRAATYVVSSVGLGLVAIWIGMTAAKLVLVALRGEG